MLKVSPIIISFLIAAMPVGVRQDRSSPASERSSLAAQPLSPHLIEWYLDINEDADLKEIWRLLKINVPAYVSSRCAGNCIAETFDIKTTEGAGQTVALKLSMENNDFYQYLIFNKVNSDPGKSSWRFVGDITLLDHRFGTPVDRIERGDNRTWIVIRELSGRGSGMRSYGEVWYEIKESALRRVLSYPVEGFMIPCQMSVGRSFKSILLRHDLEAGVYTIPVQLIVSYNISDCTGEDRSRPLFTKSQKAFYVWNDEKARFLLDTSRSELGEDELKTVYNLEGLSGEKFLQYNFYELLDIAQGTDQGYKDWLKTFLTGTSDSRFKAALQQVLGK